MPTTRTVPRRVRTLLTLLRGRRPSGQSGAAMITVIGTTMVLTALVAATLAFTVNGVRSARGDQDWQAALPAAEAGIDDYLSRLNEDGTYWRFGNPTAPFSATSSVTLPTGAFANPAFSGWTDVPGSDGRAQFRYDVDTSGFFTTGLVKLQSTGRVGERTRTVQSTIGRRNFIDYLYFTDFEVKDPDLYLAGVDSYNPSQAQVSCNRHLYDVVGGQLRRDRVSSDAPNRTTGNGCSVINFIGPGVVSGFGGDRIDGPFHSNDAVYVCGNPTITAEATTSYDGSLTGGRRYVRNTGCSATSTPQIPASSNNFAYEPPLTLPPSNTELSRQVDPTYTDGQQPGCLYTGPTRITFTSSGRMNVTSPWSKNGGSAWCGTGNNRPMPTRGVIWVRDVPATADAYSRTQAEMATQAVAGSTCTETTNPLNHPRSWELNTARRDITPYRCKAGDALVSGDVKGQVTVGAANNVVVVDDLRYADSTCSASNSCSDVIGLVANNYVEVMHPVGCLYDGSGNAYDCRNLTNQQNNLVLEAAVLSVQHSFRVQNYNLGSSMGTLTVRGAIGQKYRGAVGTTGGSGVAKNYVYDWRLRYASPPHFLDPVESAYGQKTWSEPQAAYGP